MKTRIADFARAAAGLATLLCAPPAPGAAPLLAFPDDPPAIEVRALSAPLTVRLRYGAELAPASFRATLNGVDVSAAFQPEPGAEQTVELPFLPGGNRLELEAASAGTAPRQEFLTREITYARLPGDEHAAERMKSLPELRHELWKERTPPAPEPAPAAEEHAAEERQKK